MKKRIIIAEPWDFTSSDGENVLVVSIEGQVENGLIAKALSQYDGKGDGLLVINKRNENGGVNIGQYQEDGTIKLIMIGNIEVATENCECDEKLVSEHLSLDEAEEVETILSECIQKKLFRKTHPLRIIGYFRMEIDETVYRRRKWYKCRKCGCIWEYQMPDEKGGAWIRKFADGKYPKWTIEEIRKWG